MKKKSLLWLCLLCVSFFYAQNPIQVTITGDCDYVTGEFVFNGLVNQKYNYTRTVEIEGEFFVAAVGFDGASWVLYADGDLTDTGFSNIAVPVGLLPPFTGWTRELCLTGTMIITQELTTNTPFLASSIQVFPNPATSQVTVNVATATADAFTYTIMDISGRNMGQGNANFTSPISISSLQSGVYVLQITTQDKQQVSKRFIKN
jgi:hypothetical protein